MKKLFVALAVVLMLLVSHASTVHAVLTVNHGAVFEFEGPDELMLDPATAVIAVDVFGDADSVVNGVTFRTDQPGGGTASEGAVDAITTATNSINDWTVAPIYTGADATSVSNLQFVMQDIRWEAAPAPVTVDVTGLTSGLTYNLQLLFNEGADRDRRWDIQVEGDLVVDDFSSEGEGVWTPENGFAYIGDFTLADDDTQLNVIMAQDLGGQEPMGADNNPILQGVIVHVVPEPSTFALVLMGLCGFMAYFRRHSWRA